MKTTILAIIAILICSFAVAPSLVRADQDDWYQGHRGQWIQNHNAWRFRDVDGSEYRQNGNQWQWYGGRRHGAEGSAYHNRAAGDNRSYSQFEQQNGH